MELKDLTYEHFAAHLGETVQLHRDDGQVVELRLADAQNATGERLGNSFSIIFRGPPAPRLEQRIYHLEHAALGTLSIFLVPVGEEKEAMLYEAVFTRILED